MSFLSFILSEPVTKTAEELWREYDKLDEDFVRAWHWRTQSNISVLYKLDAFDWTVLILYFTILFVLAIYGAYRIKQVADFWRYRHIQPSPKARFAESDLTVITVQLPLFNEMYVVERLLRAVTQFDYPREKFEIQVLDDSTDETVALARETVEHYQS